MEQQPSTLINACTRVKPRLLIFDDDIEQLASYCAKLSLHYEVEGVLVSDCNEADDMLKLACQNGNWSRIAECYRVHDATVFDCVKHVVCNQDELHTLLRERRPEFVLSDSQMRRVDGPLLGIHVMHAVAELLPDTCRAVHTGAAYANPATKVSELNQREYEDRAEFIKAMRTDKFKIFPKSPYHKNFDPRIIEAYFAEASAARTPT